MAQVIKDHGAKVVYMPYEFDYITMSGPQDEGEYIRLNELEDYGVEVIED